VSDGINLPGNRNRLRLGAQNGSHSSQLVSSEVAGGKGLHAARRRLWGSGLHSLCLSYIVRRAKAEVQSRCAVTVGIALPFYRINMVDAGRLDAMFLNLRRLQLPVASGQCSSSLRRSFVDAFKKITDVYER
jgi:hypothetical protein